jgi:hypothetical protein
MNRQKGSIEVVLTLFVLGLIAVVILIAMWGIPKYRVYSQDLSGQANLRQQEWEKENCYRRGTSSTRILYPKGRGRN